MTASSIDENRVQNLMGVIFSSITFVAVFQLTAVQPIVAYERSVRDALCPRPPRARQCAA